VIPAAELTALQAAAALALDKSATIERNEPSTFNLGQPVENWVTLPGMPVAAGLAQPGLVVLQQYSDFIGAQEAWIAKFPYGQDVQPQDRVVIDGITFTVHILISERSYPTLTRALVAKMVN
jgi:hypothetical protein